MVLAAPKPPPPAPPPPNGSQPKANGSPTAKRSFAVRSGISADFQKVVFYGPGGVGKTELCSLVSETGINPLFLDIGASSRFLDVPRIDDIGTFEELRNALHDDSLWNGYSAVVIDDLTKAEELATDWVVRTIPHSKNKPIKSIEDYGWGEGYTHIYEAFLFLLGDLDAHVRKGRHVICVCHECTANVPNPAGEDWIRFEPRLQSPKSGKASVRHRVKEWCDHLLFVGYDTFVNEDGKGTGSGTRTIYPVEMPTHWAKSRSLDSPIPYSRGSAELWERLFKKGE
jgi:hypothetical protein